MEFKCEKGASNLEPDFVHFYLSRCLNAALLVRSFHLSHNLYRRSSKEIFPQQILLKKNLNSEKALKATFLLEKDLNSKVAHTQISIFVRHETK